MNMKRNYMNNINNNNMNNCKRENKVVIVSQRDIKHRKEKTTFTCNLWTLEYSYKILSDLNGYI